MFSSKTAMRASIPLFAAPILSATTISWEIFVTYEQARGSAGTSADQITVEFYSPDMPSALKLTGFSADLGENLIYDFESAEPPGVGPEWGPFSVSDGGTGYSLAGPPPSSGQYGAPDFGNKTVDFAFTNFTDGEMFAYFGDIDEWPDSGCWGPNPFPGRCDIVPAPNFLSAGGFEIMAFTIDANSGSLVPAGPELLKFKTGKSGKLFKDKKKKVKTKKKRKRRPDGAEYYFTGDVQWVPEPGTYALVGAGMLGLALYRRRRTG